MVFKGVEFTSFVDVDARANVIRISGLTKKCLGPGWRAGWLSLHGQKGAFDNVKIGLKHWFNIFLMQNTIVQEGIV